MTQCSLSEVIDAWTCCNREKVDQLNNLCRSEGGARIFKLASKVMGNGILAAEWLTRGQIGLNGAIPAVVALSPEGRKAVRTYLVQIRFGVYI